MEFDFKKEKATNFLRLFAIARVTNKYQFLLHNLHKFILITGEISAILIFLYLN